MNAGAAGVDLPDLRIVRLGQLVLHEEADERRVERLGQRLAVEQVVKNPPVVATLGPAADEGAVPASQGQPAAPPWPAPFTVGTPSEGRFVVLDGANRVSALRRIGVPDVVVQVVDYDQTHLTTWYHLVAGLDPADLVTAVRDVDGADVEATDIGSAREALDQGDAVAYLAQPGGRVHTLASPSDLRAAADLLRRAVGVYKGRADIYRVQSDDLATLEPFYSEIAGLFVFPSFQPADIRALAVADAKLPTGITRHVIPHRALRVNTDLTFLWSDTPLGEKNRWLFEWTRHKLQAGEIRYYEESTFLYDE